MKRVNLIDLGTHVCHLYEGEDELKAITVPFLRDGMLNGEYCLYSTDGRAPDYWYRELEAHGLNVASARREGALDLFTGQKWRSLCQSGSINMAREVLEMLDKQLGSFPSVRIGGDASWSDDPSLTADRVCHWEATANVALGGLPMRSLCQFDLGRYEPAFIHAALRTHPVVLYKGTRLRNPYYEAPAILEHEPTLNVCTNDGTIVADMLAQLGARK